MKPTHAISVRQPWATFLLHGKDVENRNWPTKVRGWRWLHASKGVPKWEFEEGMCQGRELLEDADVLSFPRGAIIGAIEIVDCVTSSLSPWFVGEYGFVIGRVHRVPMPVTCGGALGFWHVPADVLGQLPELP